MEPQKPFLRWKNILRLLGTMVAFYGIISVNLPIEIPDVMGLPYYFIVLVFGVVLTVLPTIWEGIDRADAKSLKDFVTSVVKAWRGN